MYSASDDNMATVFWHFDFQEMRHCPRSHCHPKVEQELSGFAPQSKSLYVLRLKQLCLVWELLMGFATSAMYVVRLKLLLILDFLYINPRSVVPFRYL